MGNSITHLPSASGADAILDSARVFEDTAVAVADLRHVYAITSRQRDLILPVVTPEGAGVELRRARDQGETCGLIFGGERAGLENADVVLAGKIVTIPANPAFASLNLGQAVLIMGYEWYRAGDPPPPPEMADMDPERRPATGQEISYFFEHLEAELDESGFLRPAQRRSAMIKNLRAMWQRFHLSDHDVRTLRGMIKSLSRKGDAKD